MSMLRIFLTSFFLAMFALSPAVAPLAPFTSSAMAQDDKKERRNRKAKEPEIVYIEFDPITVSIRGESRVEGLMSIRFSIEVIGYDKAEYVRDRKPRLSNAITMYLTRYARVGIDPKRKLNVAVIDTIMQRAVDNVLGDVKTDVMVLEVNSRVL
ncbi:MAG: hypothetical protein KAI28_11255 [Sphingomonadales bacterium]|nr:hypothetical protein [Sphingomonadales bacterium]